MVSHSTHLDNPNAKEHFKGKGSYEFRITVRRGRLFSSKHGPCLMEKEECLSGKRSAQSPDKGNTGNNCVCVCVCVHAFGRWGEKFFLYLPVDILFFFLFFLFPAMVVFFQNVKEKKRNNYCCCGTMSPYHLALQS